MGSIKTLDIRHRIATARKEDERYWETRLHNFPPPIKMPVLDQQVQPQAAHTYLRAVLDLTETKKLEAILQRLKVSLNGVLLTLFCDLLVRYSGQERFAIAYDFSGYSSPVFSPDSQDPRDEFFVLGVDFTQEKRSFLDRIKYLDKRVEEDLHHQSYSPKRFVQDLAEVYPEFVNCLPMQVTFRPIHSLGNSPSAQLERDLGSTNLCFTFYQAEDHLLIEWAFWKGSLPSELVEEAHKLYMQLLQDLVSSESLWKQYRWDSYTKAQKLRDSRYNATDWEVETMPLHELFFENAKLYPHETAIISERKTLSYGEVAQFASQIAHYLMARNIGSGDLVAIVMDKDWQQIVSCLGILASGAAYLPIDSKLPASRLEELLRLGEVKAVLFQEKEREKLESLNPSVAPIKDLFLQIDEKMTQFKDLPRTKPKFKSQFEDLAYVIFTSGSTGTPKGVAITHGAAMNTILDINDRFHVSSGDRVLALSSLSFDLSVYDIFGILSAGGIVILPFAQRLKDPSHWVDLILKHSISIWDTVPMLMQMLVEFLEILGEDSSLNIKGLLKLVMLSGDWIPTDLPKKIQRILNPSKLISLGGATEASIWSIFHEMQIGEEYLPSVPYGKPLRNQRFYVLDQHLDSCPDWVIGELYIGGVGLAKGYFNDEAQTKRSFINHEQLGRIYKTGDLGRYLPSGEIQFVGRKDTQVKVGGFRVELGEIESALNNCLEVSRAVVIAKKRAQNSTDLVAFVVSGASPSSSNQLAEILQDSLKKKLPAYMLPHRYIILEAIPLTSNGKIDKAALDAMCR